MMCISYLDFFSHLQEDEKFLTEVFAQLTDERTDDSKRRELVSASWDSNIFIDPLFMFWVLNFVFIAVWTYFPVL